jgi:hypothetical protein
MQKLKRIVCLANSRKLHGRCIAGREWNDGRAGRWIRPVSSREHQEVSEYERQYEDGSDPRVLDVIDIPMVEPRPRSFQSENWLLDPEYYWERVGRLSWFDLPTLAEPASRLWLDGYSTYHGRNDKIPLEIADSVEDSLKLVYVDDLQLSVFKPGEAFGNTKRRVQGRFSHEGNGYRLWVTDPVYERQYLAKLDGTYPVGECFLTVSLGEPFGDAVYKLIATVIQEQRR